MATWGIITRKRTANVTLCVCTHRSINVDVMGRCMEMFSNEKHSYTWMPARGDADISRGRSRAATYFYEKTKDDILVFLDDDVIFEKEDLNKLVDDVVDGRKIVGAMYVQKGTLGNTIVLEQGDSITFRKGEAPQKVVAVPNGFMAIHRSVFETLVKAKRPNGDPLVPYCNKGASWAFYPFFDSQPMKMEDGSWVFAPEDWAFCLNARNCGIDTYVDPSILLSHIGEYEYDLRDRLRSKKISWEEFNGITIS